MSRIVTPIVRPGMSAPGLGTVVDCYEYWQNEQIMGFDCLIVLTSTQGTGGARYMIISWPKTEEEPCGATRSYNLFATACQDFWEMRGRAATNGSLVPMNPDVGIVHPDGKHVYEGANWVPMHQEAPVG